MSSADGHETLHAASNRMQLKKKSRIYSPVETPESTTHRTIEMAPATPNLSRFKTCNRQILKKTCNRQTMAKINSQPSTQPMHAQSQTENQLLTMHACTSKRPPPYNIYRQNARLTRPPKSLTAPNRTQEFSTQVQKI